MKKRVAVPPMPLAVQDGLPGEHCYILRPRDGLQVGPLPDVSLEGVVFIRTEDELGYLWIAVCDTCGGNCGQCGTSIGAGVPASMKTLARTCGWDKPGWGVGFVR